MSESTNESYDGVFCNLCGKPIAVSSKIARRKIESPDGPQAFAARCKQCDCEHIYSLADIKAFEGPPPLRPASQSHRMAPRWRMAC